MIIFIIVIAAIYIPIIRWILMILILLVIIVFCWLLNSAGKNDEKYMMDKFGTDYKVAIEKGELGLCTLYPCKPNPYFTSKREIESIGKVQLGDFIVKECKETLEDFTGDYRGVIIIEFSNCIDDKIIQQIEYDMKQGNTKWQKVGNHYVLHLSEPKINGENPKNDVFWSLDLQLDSSIGKIQYGRV